MYYLSFKFSLKNSALWYSSFQYDSVFVLSCCLRKQSDVERPCVILLGPTSGWGLTATVALFLVLDANGNLLQQSCVFCLLDDWYGMGYLSMTRLSEGTGHISFWFWFRKNNYACFLRLPSDAPVLGLHWRVDGSYRHWTHWSCTRVW